MRGQMSSAKSTRSDPSHSDYFFEARVNFGSLGGAEDEHSADDICPRTVAPPYEVDPVNDRIRDRGCGAKRSDRTSGDPIYVDVVASEPISP